MVGHLPQLHHHITQLTLCREEVVLFLPCIQNGNLRQHKEECIKLTLSAGGTLELCEKGLIESKLFFTHRTRLDFLLLGW